MERKAEFDRYMIAIINGCNVVEENVNNEAKQKIIEHGHWAYQQVKRMFNDECNNLGRWLSGEPCLVKHPHIENKYTEIVVGEDIDTFYYFLEYCRRQSANEELSDALIGHVLLLVLRSQSA